MRIEKKVGAEIPDYFWPKEEYSLREVVFDVPESEFRVTGVVPAENEVGILMGLDFDIFNYRVSLHSVDGEMEISINKWPIVGIE